MSNEELLQRMEEEIMDDDQEEEKLIDPEKEEESRKKAAALYTSVMAGEVKYLHQRVASILNRYEETRNSDTALMIKYWETFEGHTGDTVEIKKLFEYERLTSITRARAKIQNEYKLFLPTSIKVRRFRKEREEIEKEFQIYTKPATGSIKIFADETGKQSDYVIVASLWVPDSKREGEIKSELVKWIKDRENVGKFPKEFHFKEIDNGGSDLQHYIDFTNKFLSIADIVGFKAIGVNKSKLKKIRIQELVNELFYQLARQGVEHELGTGRIEPPKQLSYIKDEDSDDSKFMIEQLSQRIIDSFKTHYENKVTLNSVISLNSTLDRLIQISDLFAGSLNRIYNHRGNGEGKRNAKDDFADFFLESINLKNITADAESLFSGKLVKHEDMSVLYLYD